MRSQTKKLLPFFISFYTPLYAYTRSLLFVRKPFHNFWSVVVCSVSSVCRVHIECLQSVCRDISGVSTGVARCLESLHSVCRVFRSCIVSAELKSRHSSYKKHTSRTNFACIHLLSADSSPSGSVHFFCFHVAIFQIAVGVSFIPQENCRLWNNPVGRFRQ